MPLEPTQHPLPYGHIINSPGCHFSYRIIGPCCRLFDREELPWPCCRIQWRSKEPSWRRIGKRFVADIACKQAPSYSVEIVGQHTPGEEPLVLTLYFVKLPPALKEWWYASKLAKPVEPEIAASPSLTPPEMQN